MVVVVAAVVMMLAPQDERPHVQVRLCKVGTEDSLCGKGQECLRKFRILIILSTKRGV